MCRGCRHSVNSASFYEACLVQLRSHHLRHPLDNFSSAKNLPTAAHENDLYGILNELFLREQQSQEDNNSSDTQHNLHRKSHLFTATEVSDEDLGLICGLVWAYGKVCAYMNKDIIPEETTLCGEICIFFILIRDTYLPCVVNK